MELVQTHQFNYSDIRNESFDVFIMAAGHQSRCRFLYDHLTFGADTKMFLLTYHNPLAVVQNVTNYFAFHNKPFETIRVTDETDTAINQLLERLQLSLAGIKNPRILIDYSIMPKRWYSQFVGFFSKLNNEFERLTVYFSYTPPEYMHITQPRSVKTMHPLSMVHSHKTGHKPTALILGLGCEKDLATMVNLKIRPELVYTFIADPSFDNSFTCETIACNKMLLDTLAETNIIRYPANDHTQINQQLTRLCLKLRLEYNVIIVPLGPKTFTLSCLLLTLKYPDLELWEVITDRSSRVTEGKALEPPVILKAVFQTEEED